jgi:PPOX class probable F420-dependent enzyme
MLDPDLKELAASGANFAALSTHARNGDARTHIMWVDADDDHLLINTEIHRQKYKDIGADPRVTVTVWDAGNPYRYVEVRGRVVGEVRGPEARAHIDRLSHRYTGADYGARIQSERVILQVEPERIHRKL